MLKIENKLIIVMTSCHILSEISMYVSEMRASTGILGYEAVDFRSDGEVNDNA